MVQQQFRLLSTWGVVQVRQLLSFREGKEGENEGKPPFLKKALVRHRYSTVFFHDPLQEICEQ